MNVRARSEVAADLVRLARARAELTQRQLAERSGVPQSVIARIESGARQPTLPTLERILAGAGVEMRYRLAPLEDHDSVLAVRNARRSPARRKEVADAHAAFVTKVVDGGRRARQPSSE
ncbi:MAG: helix-turn-helix domain-containing protein [Acidimicrobiales bacterium]